MADLLVLYNCSLYSCLNVQPLNCCRFEIRAASKRFDTLVKQLKSTCERSLDYFQETRIRP